MNNNNEQDVCGLQIQRKASNLFSSYFNRQLLSEEVLKYETFDDGTVQSFIDLLHREADSLNLPFAQHANQFVIESITLLQSGHDEFTSNKLLYNIIYKLHLLGHLSSSVIQSEINSLSSLLPLDFVVRLDKHGIVSLVHYFQSCVDNPKKLAKWARNLVHSSCESDQNDDDPCLLRYLLMVITEVGYGTLSPEMQKNVCSSTQKAAVVMVNTITRKVWDFLWENSEKKVYVYDVTMCSSDMNSPSIINMSSVQKSYLEQLAFLLSYKPDIKATSAISSQCDWTYFKIPSNVIHFVTQLLYPIDVQAIVDKIDDILSNYEINWKTLLLIVSVIHISYPTGSKTVKGMITSLLQRAMEKTQTELFLPAFLIARQITFENSSSNYGVWFSTITNSSTSSKSFSLLVKFLTNIVRYEPASVLKSHLNNPPHIPMVDNCRGIWTDYTALVRTRILDLGNQGLNPSVAEVDSTTEKEVESAISAFDRNGRIPNSVLEAAIFRKPYFIQKFIPTLLKPRSVPNPVDMKEQFILALKRSSKLPEALYDAYVTACCQLNSTVTVTDGEDVMEWQATDKPNDYPNLLRQIVNSKESYQRSLLLDKTVQVLSELITPSKSSPPFIPLKIDEFEKELLKDQASVKIVDEWINNLKEISFVEQDAQWTHRYVLLLCPHPSLLTALYYKIWQFLNSSNNQADDAIHLFGTVIFMLCKNANALAPIHCQDFQGSFVELLTHKFLLRNKEMMIFYLKLLWNIVAESLHCKDSSELDCIQKPVQLYFWLGKRFQASQLQDQFEHYLHFVKNPHSSLVPKMTLKDWLRLEQDVQANSDILRWNERSYYLHSVFEADFKSPNADLSEICRTILDCLIQRAMHKPIASSDCSQDLLLLLQSQILQQSSSAAGSPWLILYWQQLHQQMKHGNIDLLMWSVICALPPFLLCRNGLDRPVRGDDVRVLTQLIEAKWKDSVTEGAWLPKCVTSHLSRALGDVQQLETVHCLQFARLIHDEQTASLSGPWQALQSALGVFHPRTWSTGNPIRWSGNIEVDLLTTQLIIVAAGLWFTEEFSQDWPTYVKELGVYISANPHLLKAFRIAYWIDDESLLPWRAMLPNCFVNLLPYILLHVLLSWSESLIHQNPALVTEFIETLVSAHTKWIQTTQTFIDLVTSRAESKADYPAGRLMDFAAIGRLNIRINLILNKCPLAVIRTLQFSSCFQTMDASFQTTVNNRCR